MDSPWYFRLFYMPILNFFISWLLAMIIQAKRMGASVMSGPLMIVSVVCFIGWCVVLWFVPFRIDVTFWIGICIVVFGHVVFALGYIAMREHPEKEKVVLDWGIYRISRHSHIVTRMITLFGTIIMGWTPKLPLYIMCGRTSFSPWSLITSASFMRRTSRYIGIPKSKGA